MVRARESPHFFSLCDCLDVGLSVVGVAFLFPFFGARNGAFEFRAR